MKSVDKGSAIAICAVVLAFATTLLLGTMMGDVISPSSAVEAETVTVSYYLVVLTGYGDYALAKQDALILRGLGAAGYIASAEQDYVLVLSAYDSEESAQIVASRTESASVQTVSWEEGALSAPELADTLSCGTQLFASFSECAAALDGGTLSANGVLSRVLAVTSLISEVKTEAESAFSGEAKTEVCAYLDTLSALTDNVAAVAASESELLTALRYYSVQYILSRRAFANTYSHISA